MPGAHRKPKHRHHALARQIIGIALERGMKQGAHLPEQAFSEACGVSRTPIRSAFKVLEENEILSWRQEEGYFLNIRPHEDAADILQRLEDAEESLAHRILTDRTERRLGDIQSVSALVRRYSVSRSSVLNALKVLSRDGIVTQLPGRAWAFQPMVDSPKAIDESFDFRLHTEPQAILTPGFQFDSNRAGLLRSQMTDFLNMQDYKPTAFLLIDFEFHSLIAESSGNRFLRGSLLAHHRLRKVTQKGSAIPSFRLGQAMREHLDILDSLERNQYDLAADQMTVHLRRSRIRRPEAANRGIPPLSRGPQA